MLGQCPPFLSKSLKEVLVVRLLGSDLDGGFLSSLDKGLAI